MIFEDAHARFLKSILITTELLKNMKKLSMPSHLEDKIFEIKSNPDETISQIVSYFPFSESERLEILSLLEVESFDGFRSIFTDYVTDEEWNNTKEQIKNKFKDELFDIDKTS